MRTKCDLLWLFSTVCILVILAACGSTSSSTKTDDDPVNIEQTPTVTPSGSSQSRPEDDDPSPSHGTLSIDFVDVLVQEICSFDLPFKLEWKDGQGIITGETEASCSLSAIQCGDACVTMNSDWELEVSLAGTVYVDEEDAPDGEIHADFVFSGILMNYASEWPPGAIPPFTIEQPFIVEQPGLILPLVLSLQEGASTSISPEGGGEPINFTLRTLSP